MKNNNEDLDQKNKNDDLQWIALEKLPTYDRLRKCMLTDIQGTFTEVDMKKIGSKEKKELMQRLFKAGEVDNRDFLLNLRERINRVGIDIPNVEVRFENLCVDAQVYVGKRALPTIYNSLLNTLEGYLHSIGILPETKRSLQILHNVSGIIKPGRMTLLLGPPSSGKTSLLLALAGRLINDLKVSGGVSYNGHRTGDFVAQRSSAYISQYDLHIPNLTVRETLEFSRRCQGVGTNYDMLVELLRREKEANITPNFDIDMYMKAAASEDQNCSVIIDYILKILGLEACADTLVGNQMIRGISGGEKKRVTIGEMLVGPAKAFFMDEISTGLDTSTTFQIVNAIGQSIHILNGTAVISLLQPAPEVYDLFDDVILLSEGQIIYQGPTENVLEFFESMGFKCPDRKGVADYLQEVTSRRDQEQYWMHKDEPYRFVTTKDFAQAFQAFHVGKKLDTDLSVPFDKSKSQTASLTTKFYGVKKKDLFKACMSREFLLMKRHSFVYIFKISQLIFLALLGVTVFLRTHMRKKTLDDGDLFMGALFFAILRIMYSGITEIAITVGDLPVFFKQRDLLFYPAWAYSLSKWILKIPLSIVESAIWVSITYYGMGFDHDFGRFFGQWMILLALHQMTSGLFRFVAGVSRKIVLGSTLGAFLLSIYMMLGGFVISRDFLTKWWVWGYWASPLMYAQNAMAVNEFLGKSWSHIPSNSTKTLGVQILEYRGLFVGSYWYPLGVSALFGFCFLFNFLFTLTLTYLNSPSKARGISPEEEENGQNKQPRELNTNFMDVLGKKRVLVLPFEPLSITFDEITYAVDMPQRMKNNGVTGEKLELLKGINGGFRPGVLTTLMGVSGAGKTTLLDVLSGRKTSGYIQGTIKISGYPKNQETFARISGYVEQNDIHSPHLTVYESLIFSSRLRLPSSVDPKTREMFVEEVMGLVELTPLKEALVGVPGVNGLSKEQRKRLTIALELVANPSIIFMDEPTSGLDARAAAIVMRTVKNTVNSGRTVVCTIHQPSIDIFDSFDELLLLKRGGEEIYFGPVGIHGKNLIQYFEGIDGVRKIKNGENPATWMMDITSATQEQRLGVSFANIYEQSEQKRLAKGLVKEMSKAKPGSRDLHFPNKYSRTYLTQFMTCLWKQRLSYSRNIDNNGIRLLYTTFLGLVIGSIFWKIDSERGRKQDLMNAMGCMYATVNLLGVRNSSSVQSVVTVERTVVNRERSVGMYSPLAYALAQVIIEFPYCFLQTIMYGITVYPMIGFELNVVKFLWFFYFTFFTIFYYTTRGMMVAAISPNLSISTMISSIFNSTWTLFSGFIIPKTRIPIWWRWYIYANPTSWSIYGLIVSQYGEYDNKLENGETVKEFLRSYFGYQHDFLWVVAVVVPAFSLLFLFIFAFAIKTLNFQKR